MLRKILFTMIVCLLVASLVSYAQDTDEQEDTSILLIGTVTDAPDEFVGLVIDGETATLYICDGQAAENTVSIAQWFTGTVEDDALDVTLDNGKQLQLTLTDETATGQITLEDGTVKIFELTLAVGDAALYRSEFAFGEDAFVGGWLVLPDGSIRGAVQKKGSAVVVPAALNANIASIRDGTSNIQDGTSNTAK